MDRNRSFIDGGIKIGTEGNEPIVEGRKVEFCDQQRAMEEEQRKSKEDEGTTKSGINRKK